MRHFPALDDLQGLSNQDSPDVLSMWCLTLGCGRRDVEWSSFHAKHNPAIRRMAVANSRSLIEIRGGLRNLSVFSRISIGQGKWKRKRY